MAHAVSGRDSWGEQPDLSRPCPYRARIIPQDFDWEGDRPLELPMQDLIIYETHVRGFTRSLTSAVNFPGTFAGVRENIRLPEIARGVALSSCRCSNSLSWSTRARTP